MMTNISLKVCGSVALILGGLAAAQDSPGHEISVGDVGSS